MAACAGPADAVCAEAHFLRARGCARLAGGDLSETAVAVTRVPANLSETARAEWLACAVESGRAALAASAATAPAGRAAWRDAFAEALFTRRQSRPGGEVCADNAELLDQADRLRAERPDAARPRYLAASARLTAAARNCGPPACPALAEAAALLRDPPATAGAGWRSLSAGVAATARRLGCGG